jgi:asparagine synthase (glutamine-hydrolysing)
MCGFAGLLDLNGATDERATARLIADMRDRLTHRGPDDAGVWLDPARGVALGFRRLSIIDLSAAGHQPMLSADGRYAVVMNGEIYNFAEIRAEIEATRGEAAGGPRAWRGHSDTEVLVEAISLWGVEPALRRANGMFAVAAWDREERVLWLARDRLGKKPLYYGLAGDTLVFGSELKALWPHPEFDFRIDTDALANFMQLGYVPGARTIFSAVSKLQNGHVLRFDPAAAARHGMPPPSAYWSMRTAAVEGLDAQESGRGAASVEELDALVHDAVALRMVADVPVGAFLSGGIDSSLVTALMAASSPHQIRTFSIGFGAEGWDEARHAKEVAKHLGTRHEESYVGTPEALAILGDMPAMFDEPFADDSMIPTAILCRMARRSVTVALSGDGGDELFAGYDKYTDIDRWGARCGTVPRLVRSLGSELVNRVAHPAAGRWGDRRAERRTRIFGLLLGDAPVERINEAIMSHTPDPGSVLSASDAPRHPLVDGWPGLGRSTAIDRMTFMDAGSYLIDDILVKVDRASMATSLEVRCPLLDYRLVEMSWRFRTSAKTSGGVGKRPLREVLDRYVPRVLIERPKKGFCAPVEVWLRNELREWGEALMSRQALGRHGLLDVEACRNVWEAFILRGGRWNPLIWNLMMFQAWHEWMTKVADSRPAVRAPLQASAAD